MKLVTYTIANWQNRFHRIGAVVDGSRVIDLNWAYASFLCNMGKQTNVYALAARRVPADMIELLKGGEESLDAARQAVDYAKEAIVTGSTLKGPAGEQVLYRLDDVTLKAPIPRPGKVLAGGRNFRAHLDESVEGWKEKWGVSVPAPKFPIGFVKVSTAITGPYDPVVYPKVSKQLDYEIEFGIVIGKKGKYIAPEQYLDYVAGYIVMNDTSARDWQVGEMKNQLLVLGKNFDTLGPMGPWLVTKDEIPDPHALEMELRVNGDVKQHSNTGLMIFKIPDLMAHWSQMTLEPGDILTSGTPEGVALHRKPISPEWFLKPGDMMETEISGIGTLRNPIVAEQ